ncbi:MAG: hypothetical protein ACYCPQ_02375 [Elusimicrobiota bacterium]
MNMKSAIRGSLVALVLCGGWAGAAEIDGAAEMPSEAVAVPEMGSLLPVGSLELGAGFGNLSIGERIIKDAPAPGESRARAIPAIPQEAAAVVVKDAPSYRRAASHEKKSSARAISRLAAAVSLKENGSSTKGRRAALDAGFDGAVAAPGLAVEDAGVSVPSAAGLSKDDEKTLGAFYPRVVFVQDVFSSPASDKIVASLEKLLDAGVHMIVLTQRPLKGPGSVDEMLLSKLKNRSGNPVMVASYGGGKISFAGRAKNPKSLLEDEPGFNADVLSRIRAVAGRLSPRAKKSAWMEEILPSPANPLAYVLAMSPNVPEAQVNARRKSALSAFHRMLASSKLPYRANQFPGDPRRVMIEAVPLYAALPRVYRALDDQFAEEKLLQSPEKFLVLADPSADAGLASRFPAAADIQAVKSAKDVEAVLGAVLKDQQLPSVSVKLGKLRQFVEYWEPRKLGQSQSLGGGSRGSSGLKSGAVDKDFGRYTGAIMNQLLGVLYDQVNRGNHAMTSLAALQARLRQMWYSPLKYGVFVDRGLLKVMHTKSWRARQHGYLDYANAYLINFYLRQFHDYPAAAADIRAHLLRLKTDWNSGLTVDFRSAATGRDYKIHTRIPRTMWRETAQGRMLEAYAYRTGKESFGDGEELYAQILAMALLKGDARPGTDGLWHMGAADGPVISGLKVQIEYRSGHRTWTFEPDQFLHVQNGGVVEGPVAQKITGYIERMEADAEYGDYYKQQEDGVSPADWAKRKTTVKKTRAASRARRIRP